VMSRGIGQAKRDEPSDRDLLGHDAA
jgi:hypothetical protein